MDDADPLRVPPAAAGASRMLQRLVERIRRGSCVLVLGPGVAVDADVPLTRALSNQLAQSPPISESKAQLDPDNLRQAAELFYQLSRDRDELNLTVTEFYERYRDSTTPFHNALAELPFRLCICTTPDDFMFNAFRAAKVADKAKLPVKAYYSLRPRFAARGLPEPTELAPVVFHLYGHVDDPNSLILTESDLIEFLVAVVRGDPPPPDMIRGKLGHKDTEFVFVGFGFLNWYVRVLLHVFNVYGHNNRPVALEDKSFFDDPGHVQTVMFFSGERSIEFQHFTWNEFATRLRDSYLASVKPGSHTPLPSMANAPRAFLCYADDDRDVVEQLAIKLQQRGVAVWQDKQNLRAGDNWDRALTRVIKDQVDYMIVCQSTAMDRRVKGYYHKEIEIALAQQVQYQDGLRFLISARLDACRGNPLLSDLHFVDARTDDGVDSLAKSILEDWEARKQIISLGASATES